MTEPGHESVTLVTQLERRQVSPILPVRDLRSMDRGRLASAMLAAYHGGFDDPNVTMADIHGYLWKFFDSGLAAPLPECSFAAVDEDRIVSVTQVCFDDGRPLLARAYTIPSWQNHGLARALIQLSENALLDRGERVLAVMVMAGNRPARHLYASMGFVVECRAE